MVKDLKRIEVVIPVYNEEKCLEENIIILSNFLSGYDYNYKIVIADNASTDRTAQIALSLSKEYERIDYLFISRKGRGLALRNTFLKSESDIVCYMDVDLSTNLKYLRLLIESIDIGFDISIGTRLLRASRVKRSLGREIISRCYNLLIKLLFMNKFSDAQCGFKACKTEVAKKIIPLIKNNNWFFDTEFLLIAEYNKYRIFEVPVEWIEDLDSRVHIIKTIFENIKGLLRLRFSIHRNTII